MCRFKILLLVVCIISLVVNIYAGFGKPPAGWDDFKFGVVDANAEPWKTQLVKALEKGVKIDYRYRYCTEPGAVTGWLFTPWYNYANGPNGIRPSITIYMMAKNTDDLTALMNSGKDKAYMTSYFNAIKSMADSCKGKKAIYVIEPDVWGYFLQFDMGGLGGKYFSQTCNINNVGIPCLSGFSNTFADLAMAIIALVKNEDPGCYAGVLMAHWGFNSFWLPSPEQNANNTVPFLKKFLRDNYKGDFIAFEKYGSDAGSCDKTVWLWDDAKNANFITWSKTVAKGIDLPIVGWQTSIGYQNGKEPGYADLPNTANRYEDSFFPYFFRHVNDFLNAGFIGYLATCNNQANGTVMGMTKGEYDNGWFVDRLTEFDTKRPYNLNISTGTLSDPLPVQRTMSAVVNAGYIQISLPAKATQEQYTIDLISAYGRTIRSVIAPSVGVAVTLSTEGVASGVYVLSVSGREKGECNRIRCVVAGR